MAFDTEERYELDNGIVRMMAGGAAIHARIQSNVFLALGRKLDGSGCSPFGPDMGIRTHRLSLRYPDISVFCGRNGPENDNLKAFVDPRLVVEVLSKGTRTRDIEVKLPEYRTVTTLEAIIYIDPEDDSVHLETRDADRNWVVATCGLGGVMEIPPLSLSLTWDDVFSRR